MLRELVTVTLVTIFTANAANAHLDEAVHKFRQERQNQLILDAKSPFIFKCELNKLCEMKEALENEAHSLRLLAGWGKTKKGVSHTLGEILNDLERVQRYIDKRAKRKYFFIEEISEMPISTLNAKIQEFDQKVKITEEKIDRLKKENRLEQNVIIVPFRIGANMPETITSLEDDLEILKSALKQLKDESNQRPILPVFATKTSEESLEHSP